MSRWTNPPSISITSEDHEREVPSQSGKAKNRKKLSLSTFAAQKLGPAIQISSSVPSTPVTMTATRKSPPKLPTLNMDLVGIQRRTSMPVSNRDAPLDTPLESSFTVVKEIQADQATDGACEDCDADVYTSGPVCIESPNLFLYSAPSAHELRQFDVVINVAKEISNPLLEKEKFETTCAGLSSHADAADSKQVAGETDLGTCTGGFHSSIDAFSNPGTKGPEYIHMPWQHNQAFAEDLPHLTALIDRKTNVANQKVLIHCQQGVSRSASLVIAYIMKSKSMDINEAYAYVKNKSPCIGPNMSLIYQLCEWGKTLARPNIKENRRSFDVNGAKTLDDYSRPPRRKRATTSLERGVLERSRSAESVPTSRQSSVESFAATGRVRDAPDRSCNKYLSPRIQQLEDLHIGSTDRSGDHEHRKIVAR